MKKLFIALMLLVFSCTTALNIWAQEPNWPSLDVWVVAKHAEDPFGDHPACTVIIHIEKGSIYCDDKNCPAEDTKVVGEMVFQNGISWGFHVVTLKKGMLNDPKSFSFSAPKRKFKIKPDWLNIWTATR